MKNYSAGDTVYLRLGLELVYQDSNSAKSQSGP